MKRILLIEDDQIAMNLIVILLERGGYEVATASTAEAGITLAAGRPPDLILMDIALPGKDGLEAARAGCDGFIAKSVSTRIFISEIADYLQRANSPERVMLTS